MALVAGLVVGGFLGARLAQWSSERDAATPLRLVAGSVERMPFGGESGPVFGLPLHNGSTQTVELVHVGIDGLGGEIVTGGHQSLAPGSWRTVTFGAPADCGFGGTGSVDDVRLTVRTDDGDRRLRVSLPGGGQPVVDYHEAVCAPQAMPRPRDLAGVWLLEDSFGEQEFVGTMVWRFGRAGRFVADWDGAALQDVAHPLDGRYSLRDGRMRIDAVGGYAFCDGIHSALRPSLVDGPEPADPEFGRELTARWLKGDCPDGLRGQLWTFKRVLRGGG